MSDLTDSNINSRYKSSLNRTPGTAFLEKIEKEGEREMEDQENPQNSSLNRRINSREFQYPVNTLL